MNAFSDDYDKLRFLNPVFINDTIHTIKTDLDKSPKYPDMGLYCEHIQTVKYRHPENFTSK